MAHFAEIKSSDNVVLRVVVVNNSDVEANGGDYSATAETWVANNIAQDPVILSQGDYPDTYWKQTSYNNNARYNYAEIDGTWDNTNQAFIAQKPFESWTLDSSYRWVAPVADPSTQEIDGITILMSWDETNSQWLAYKSDGTGGEYVWNVDNSAWESNGNPTVLTGSLT
jgi:hypothetical protein